MLLLLARTHTQIRNLDQRYQTDKMKNYFPKKRLKTVKGYLFKK